MTDTMGKELQDSLPFDGEKFSVARRECFDYVSKGGEDTIYLNLRVHWDRKFAGLLAQLKALKEQAQKSAVENLKTFETETVIDEETGEEKEVTYEVRDMPELVITGHTLRVLPQGLNPGNSKFTHFPYMACEHGFRYLISGRNLRQTTASGNLYIMIGSEPLMKWGIENCVSILEDCISRLGGAIESCTISRVDLCVDLPGVSVEPFVRAFLADRFVCRARCSSTYVVDNNGDEQLQASIYRFGKRPTGLVLGRGNVMCRIYDKKFESRNDEVKTLLLVNNRWGGVVPEVASRVEFQIRREALRNFSIPGVCSMVKTLKNYLDSRGAICDYLCRSWLRFYACKVDKKNGNTGRLKDDKLLPEWKQVQDYFASVGRGEHSLLRVEKKTSKPADRRLKLQGLGCFTSCIAHIDGEEQDKVSVVREINRLILSVLDGMTDDDVRKIVRDKKSRFRSAHVESRGFADVPF